MKQMNYKADQGTLSTQAQKALKKIRLISLSSLPDSIKMLIQHIYLFLLPSPKGVAHRDVQLNGVRCEYYESTASNGCDDKLMLYFHGGAYNFCSTKTHRKFVKALHQLVGLKTYSVDYRMAPQHPYPAAVDDAYAVWVELTKTHSASNIVISGDSAGGGLTLALMQRLIKLREPLPCATFLIAPWTDLSCSLPSWQTNINNEIVLKESRIKQCAELYRGDTNIDHSEISPLFGDWDQCPPSLIHVGSEEVLLDDSVELAKKSDNFQLKVWPGMWHVFHVDVANIPESRRAAEEGMLFLKENLSKQN